MALCVLSAVGFGAMAVFAKEAYGAGFDVPDLLALRFGAAALVFWAVVRAAGAAVPPRRVAVAGLLMGACGYAAQAGLYFGALTRIDASLTALLLYLYPVLVFVAALALGREHASPRRLGALGLATVGTALLLLGGQIGGLDALGVTMAAGAAVVYTAYLLVADRVLAGADPLALSACVMTGVALATGAAALASGGLQLGVEADGWAAFAGVSLVSTVLAVMALFAGLRLVGPATASIVSCVEPVVTVGLAMAIYGETLGAPQVLGGGLVLAAVVVLQLRAAGSVAADAPADHAAAPAPARALAREPA